MPATGPILAAILDDEEVADTVEMLCGTMLLAHQGGVVPAQAADLTPAQAGILVELQGMAALAREVALEKIIEHTAPHLQAWHAQQGDHQTFVQHIAGLYNPTLQGMSVRMTNRLHALAVENGVPAVALLEFLPLFTGEPQAAQEAPGQEA